MNHMTWNKENKDHWLAVVKDHTMKAMAKHPKAGRLEASCFWDEEARRICFVGFAQQPGHLTSTRGIESVCLPEWLMEFAEEILSWLEPDSDEQLTFPSRLLEVIPTDTNIKSVMHKIAIKRLKPLALANPNVSHEINTVIGLHERYKTATKDEWTAAWIKLRLPEGSPAREAVDSANDSIKPSIQRAAIFGVTINRYMTEISVQGSAKAAVNHATWWSSMTVWSAWKREADNLIAALQESE